MHALCFICLKQLDVSVKVDDKCILPTVISIGFFIDSHMRCNLSSYVHMKSDSKETKIPEILKCHYITHLLM